MSPPFVHVVRPRYAEVDAQRVVFNAHWLTYFDDATTRFYEALGFDPKTAFFDRPVFDVMVVRAVLEWQGPASFDDEVRIEVATEHLGNKSFSLSFRASVEGRPACAATVTYVSVVPGTHESTPVPAALREALERARRAPGAEGDAGPSA